MMDPFSLVVGMTGLGLAVQTIEATKAYVHSAKHAKDTTTEMLQELNALHFNLSRLDKLLKIEEAARPFDQTSVLVSSTDACRTKLTAIYQKLDGASQSRLNQLKWPLSKNDLQETIVQQQSLFPMGLVCFDRRRLRFALQNLSRCAGNLDKAVRHLPVARG